MLPSSRSLRARVGETLQQDSLDNRSLEVVIPFTTLRSVQRSIRNAERMCAGLNPKIRVVRVALVPYPLDLEHPAVAPCAISEKMKSLEAEVPLTIDIRLSRDQVPGLLAALPEPALVVLTRPRRMFLETQEQKIARALSDAGHQVSLFLERKENG